MSHGDPRENIGSAKIDGVNRRQMLSASLGAALAGATTSTSAGVLDGIARAGTAPSLYKRRAMADYQTALARWNGCLANSLAELRVPRSGSPTDVDILIIGSGYGASVCAARLSQRLRPGVRLAVMERGREWIPGTFPDNRTDATHESRFDLTGRGNRVVNPLGLFNAARFEEVSVLTGNGLGGGSLLNASVAIRPPSDVFDDPRWPAIYQSGEILAPYYDRAAYELGAQRECAGTTSKMRMAYLAAQRHGGGVTVEPADIVVTRGEERPEAIRNRQGMRQRPCIGCGDCITGCNVGAKNTLAHNYLFLAKKHGARIFTQCEAMELSPTSNGYQVHFRHYETGMPERRGVDQCLTARLVIVAAGSLGSTELLLRSQSNQLQFSPRLGRCWTANGDALGFVVQVPCETNIAGRGAYVSALPPIGPTIQANLRVHDATGKQRFLIQEGALSRAYANVLGTVLRDLDFDHTMLFFAMGADDANGTITLDDKGLAKVSWPGLQESEYRQAIRQEFTRLGAALGGQYRVLRAFGDNLVTVHAMGGCNMADSAQCGVVNDRGQVFNPAADGHNSSGSIHPGLYVVDGSIVPTPLGVNPFLTISSLAERMAEEIVSDGEYGEWFGVG